MKIENLFNVSISAKLGLTKYRVSESTGEELTPQALQAKAKAIVMRRPFVMSGLHQRIMFVNGKDLKAELSPKSKNTKGALWVQSWINQRKASLNQARYMSAMNWYTQGNVYFEPIYREGDKSGELFLDNITVVPDSSRIYYNTDYEDGADFWIYEVDDEITNIKYRGKTLTTAKYRPYKFSPSSIFFDKFVKAFTLAKNKLFHLKMPFTIDGYYGHSFIMSSIDDEEAINKIIRNLVTISTNKAVGKKIISVQSDKGNISSTDDIDTLEQQLDLDQGENIIINKPIKVDDLASQGTYDTMMPEIEYLTKDIVSGLLPSFMTPWNNSMSIGNAQHARLPFIMSNESEKKILEDFWTAMLIELLKPEAESKGISLEGVEIGFGETQYYSLEERKDFYSELYEQNMITLNQYLTKLDMEILENGDIYKRERDAQLDDKFEMQGRDNFDVNPKSQKFGLPTLNEAIKKVSDEELHDFEFDEEERQMAKKTKKELNEADEELITLIDENID